jgi:hypothetical protein
LYYLPFSLAFWIMKWCCYPSWIWVYSWCSEVHVSTIWQLLRIQVSQSSSSSAHVGNRWKLRIVRAFTWINVRGGAHGLFICALTLNGSNWDWQNVYYYCILISILFFLEQMYISPWHWDLINILYLNKNQSVPCCLSEHWTIISYQCGRLHVASPPSVPDYKSLWLFLIHPFCY